MIATVVLWLKNGDCANQILQLQQKLDDYANQTLQLQQQNDDLQKRFDSYKNNSKLVLNKWVKYLLLKLFPLPISCTNF